MEGQSLKFKRIEPIKKKPEVKKKYYLTGIDSLVAVPSTQRIIPNPVSKPASSGIAKIAKRPEIKETPIEKLVSDVKIKITGEGNKDILFCIFNYRQDENARRWVKILSPHFKTVVLDSGNDKKCDDFTQFPNIYYSGLFNEMKKIQNKEHYDWVGIITSDIEIDDKNGERFINGIKWLLKTNNIGVYSILGDSNGHSNKFQYATSKYGTFRYAEGFFQVIRKEVIDKIPTVDTNINVYGYGIDYVTCYISNMLKKMIYIDEDINIYHPKDKGYSPKEAVDCQKKYYNIIKTKYFPDFTVTVKESAKRNNLIDGFERVTYTETTKKHGLSIILTAYNVADYIGQTLNSIYEQQFIKDNNNYEVLIGIDGCEATLEAVKKVMKLYRNIRVLMMNSNKGTFVTSNTLIKESKYDKILRFDSDDLMLPNMLSKILTAARDYDIVRYGYNDYYDDGTVKKQAGCAFGSVLYDYRVFRACGGYKNWKCSGDYEIFNRVKKHFLVKEILEPLYNHRIRSNSLMHQKDTAMNSDYRKKLNATVRVFGSNENIYIEPECNTFTEIYSDHRENTINIFITSWKKRIGGVPQTVNSLLKNTIQPDAIYFTLSTEEFPGKESELPQSVKDMLKNQRIHLVWTDKNTKTIKKLYPAINNINDDDIIITADDDIDFAPNFIQLRLDDFKKHGEKCAISANNKSCRTGINTLASGSLMQKKMLKGWETFINDEVISTYEDDHINAYLIYLNGYKAERCSSYHVWQYKFFTKKDSAGAAGLYKSKTTNAILDKRVKELYGKSFDEIIKA